MTDKIFYENDNLYVRDFDYCIYQDNKDECGIMYRAIWFDKTTLLTHLVKCKTDLTVQLIIEAEIETEDILKSYLIDRAKGEFWKSSIRKRK